MHREVSTRIYNFSRHRTMFQLQTPSYGCRTVTVRAPYQRAGTVQFRAPQIVRLPYGHRTVTDKGTAKEALRNHLYTIGQMKGVHKIYDTKIKGMIKNDLDVLIIKFERSTRYKQNTFIYLTCNASNLRNIVAK